MLRGLGGKGSDGSVDRGAEKWPRDRLHRDVLVEDWAGRGWTDLSDLALLPPPTARKPDPTRLPGILDPTHVTIRGDEPALRPVLDHSNGRGV